MRDVVIDALAFAGALFLFVGALLLAVVYPDAAVSVVAVAAAWAVIWAGWLWATFAAADLIDRFGWSADRETFAQLLEVVVTVGVCLALSIGALRWLT